MGFDITIVPVVSYNRFTGKPYTHFADGDYVLSIPVVPEELRSYIYLRGSFWADFFTDKEEYSTTYFLDEILSECEEEHEDLEGLKALLKWCNEQACTFTIVCSY